MSREIPTPTSQAGLLALKAMLHAGHPLAALQVFHAEMGDVFRINLPGFTPVVMVGPKAARFVLVSGREDLRWRNEADPVTRLLRHGVLVEDGAEHDRLRHLLNPPLHKRMLEGYLATMWANTLRVCDGWADGATPDMLVEMRKIALLNLMDTLYAVDYGPHMRRLWQAVLGSIRYISPGLWMVWRGAPRPGYRKALAEMDGYLYEMIAERRRMVGEDVGQDMLSLLIQAGLDDDLIRDQLLTMLIAGHDTVTALMAWALYLLGEHPQALRRVKEEVMALDPNHPPAMEELARLEYLGWVIKEALRLYPPIHLSSRVAAAELEYEGFRIPAGERVIYSIYLTQRHPAYWEAPDEFRPERHAPGQPTTPYAFLAFGGGPRNCIGAAFGQVEAKVVLVTMLQRFALTPAWRRVRPHMGATLEPHPGVRMRVRGRK